MFDLQGLNVYLVGMMGSGKSSIGPLLAQQLGYNFIDTDETIERASGRTIPQLFAESGEPGFRAIESQVLGEVAAYTRLVIGTGGGIVTQKSNWSHLQQGLVIWLDVPIPVLAHRLRGEMEHRPILSTEEDLERKLDRILLDRASLYANADVRISIGAEDTLPAIVDRMMERIPSVLKAQPSS
jgi:shikimate kinase